MQLRILIIGMGSMGKRRLRLLRAKYPQVNIAGVDSREDRLEEARRLWNIDVSSSLDGAFEVFSPQAVIVSTSPESHGKLVCRALEEGCHTFSEIDLLRSSYERISMLQKEKGKVAFLSSTFLYRDEIRWMQDHAMLVGDKGFYTYHVGQYLADWHPWEKPEDFFVGHTATNGVRELLCVELPWLVRSFGPVESYQVQWSSASDLDLVYPDVCQCLFRHAEGSVGTMTVDVVSRKACRQFVLSGSRGTLRWNGTRDSLCFDSPSEEETRPFQGEQDHVQKGYAPIISETPYERELDAFIAAIEGDASLIAYDYQDHRYILDLVDKLEDAWKTL